MAGINNLKPWPKGVSGNPHGTPRLPPEVRLARRRNQAELIRLVISHFAMTEAQIIHKLAESTTTQLERAIQGMVAKAREGDTNAFKYLVELVCGKIPEQDPESPAEEMSPEEKLEVLKRAVVMLEDQVKGNEK